MNTIVKYSLVYMITQIGVGILFSSFLVIEKENIFFDIELCISLVLTVIIFTLFGKYNNKATVLQVGLIAFLVVLVSAAFMFMITGKAEMSLVLIDFLLTSVAMLVGTAFGKKLTR